MSTYKKATRHPQSGKYEVAIWHDDYFGPGVYGVEFPSDKKIYPTDMVEKKQIETLWAEDVIKAFKEYHINGTDDPEVVEFLNLIEDEYKARWERDPVGGEGAVDWASRMFGRPMKKVEDEKTD